MGTFDGLLSSRRRRRRRRGLGGSSFYAQVAELPQGLKNALSHVGYGRKDVEVIAAETVTPSDMGGEGSRAFTLVVDLGSGAIVRELWGSWGGANMFNPQNQVDLDTKDYPILPNAAAVKGSTGGGRPVWARVYVHPETLAKMLPAGGDELTERHRRLLGIFKSLKSGSYRNEALQEMKATREELDFLVQNDYLKRNAAGAMQITTRGKNAAASGIY